jgi:broad specificity phosphatase PhoE
MMRQVDRRRASRVLIVTHGLALRCFVMRFLHLTVEQFNSLANPKNCDVITLGQVSKLAAPLYRSGDWAVEGLGLRG